MVNAFLSPPPPVEKAPRLLPNVLSRIRPEGKRDKAAAAWKLARALRALYPGRLRVVEAGMWAESYHVLVFCDARRPTTVAAGAGEPLAMLNVGGSLHLVARADGRPLLEGISPVLAIVPWGLLCDFGREESDRRDRRRARALTVTAMAAALGL